MSKAPDIIGFGAVAVDDVVRVDRSLGYGKGRVIEQWQAHGGNVATALVAASALGATAGYVGWLSSDPLDQAVSDSLSSRGVELCLATRSADAKPIRSTIIVDDAGERFIAFRDDTKLGAPPDLRLEDMSTARYLLIDGYAAHTPEAVRKAVSLGLTVIADIEWSLGCSTDELLALCQHLVLPWNFAASVTGEGTVQAIVNALWSADRKAVVITRGDSGAWVRQDTDSRAWHQASFAANVIDTTGCGDWFHGAYVCALSQGLDPLQSVRFASAAAALSAEYPGGRSTEVTCMAVQRLLDQPGAPEPVLVPS